MKKTPLNRKTPMRRGELRTTIRSTKPRKPLPKQSTKRKRENVSYAAAKREYRARDGYSGQCEAFVWPKYPNQPGSLAMRDGNDLGSIRCRRAAVDIHHMAGRGKNLCNQKFFLACCRQHHDEFHQSPKEARYLGYIVDPKTT